MTAMRLQLLVNGRPRMVSIEPGGKCFRIAVDGRERVIDIARLGPTAYSLLVEGTGHEVGIVETGGRDELTVHLREGIVPVQVSRPGRPGRASGTDPSGGDIGARAITASMPGKVVRVLVSVGDVVSIRQGVVVVEAMKMENELRTPKAGRVVEVKVHEGMLVEAGRVLVVVD